MTKGSPSRAVALLTCALLAAVPACTNKKDRYVLTGEICSIPINVKTLSPLLPEGKEIKGRTGSLSHPLSSCKIYVDKELIIFIEINQINNYYDPETSKEYRKIAHSSVIEALPFEGKGVAGDTDSIVIAKCSSPKSKYVITDVTVRGDFNEKTSERRHNIESFAREFTVATKKKIGCTS
ncbi:hypothetical protein [Streptomyces sp. NBC_01429]|uniref:hypothetical protein n=1 Tax=Streptomyces sp. NBC_01429 TaxID=2903862 RepID=UPI002E2BC125|nr:hypothetical protein [Streptomyces sp. NBC_01429]